jgi:hypothetical protein
MKNTNGTEAWTPSNEPAQSAAPMTSNSLLIDLLACPFCGGPAEEWTANHSAYGDSCTIFHAGCLRCKIRPYSCVAGPWGYKKRNDMPSDAVARDEARLLWNVRMSG